MIAVFSILTFTVGFILGKYHERINWNKLIRKGVIPRPRNADNL